jgi:hypothetical protein
MSNAKWDNNELQFARLIAEIEAAGGFTKRLVQDLCTSMDLEKNQITELIDRAQSHWDGAKDMPTVEELHAEGDMADKYPSGRNNEDEEQTWEWNGRSFSVYVSSGKGEVPPGATVSEIL